MSLSSPQKFITIATDISADSSYKIATWACYIRYSGGVIKESGVFKEYPSNTTKAETYALANALVIASKLSDYGQSRIIIHNEIERVLTPLRTKGGNLAVKDIDRTEVVLNVIMPLLDNAQSWELRKIKAHYKDWEASPDRSKYFINRWCDIESRSLMRYERRKQKQCLQSKIEKASALLDTKKPDS